MFLLSSMTLMPFKLLHMKFSTLIYFAGIALLLHCAPLESKASGFDSISRVKSGKPVSVMLTSYSTTLLANGKDYTRLRIAVTDSLVREITSATDSIRIYITGDGKVTDNNGGQLSVRTDTAGKTYSVTQLVHGTCHLVFVAGTTPDKVKVEARSGKLWPGSHEIHTLPADLVMMKPKPDQLPSTTKPIGLMIGADISFLPQTA
jgi:hypothetical protein